MNTEEALGYLAGLSETERERLVTALQSGRLKTGASRLMLSSLGLGRHAEALGALTQWSAAQLVPFWNGVVGGRRGPRWRW